MQLERLTPGDSVPDVLNVVIEIPAHAAPVKYEVDKKSGAVMVDRFINVPMYYPANYGFVPNTLSEDGDPLDVLVITPTPVAVGCVVPCRPIDALDMSDESGRDLKIVALPVRGMNGGYDDVETVEQLPGNLLDQMAHFFEHYKKLEPGKWVKIRGWLGADRTRAEILDSVRRCSTGADVPGGRPAGE